ncbi:lactonase family protein [Algoriphagus halophytocola]|uniref:Lactonase family protein n=1 Tax=Algoriphagus halophytocola TaxID=2991499 RepID=A0ABY6MJ36_9BACT|nr:lactonase family protein [Algoriphagus sp. TR-M5]UZD22994.1 lactonase family protein [Algoriphagus sp. TR-M5]
MKKLFSFFLFASLIWGCSPNKPTEVKEPTKTYSFLVGTYTDDPNQGINQLDFTPATNSLEVRVIYPGIQNPSFVLANASGDEVFAVEEIHSETGGNILSLQRSNPSEALKQITTMPTFGDHPCYLALSPDERFITVANYSGGSVSVYKIEENAKLRHLQTEQHSGKSINEARQEAAHVHSTVFSSDGNFLLTADLGSDEITIYDFDPNSPEPLTINNTFKTQPGDGPRHMIFTPDGSELLVVQELTAALEIFDFQSGKLTSKQRVALMADTYKGEVGAAEVRISPDGNHVYASNRGEANSLTVYEKRDDGKYWGIQLVSSGGSMPRNFNLTADGKYLLSANQASNEVVVFERDPATGKLSETDLKVEIHKPVYLHRLAN